MIKDPECVACGADAITYFKSDDGAKQWYCRQHIPDPETKALYDMLHATRFPKNKGWEPL